MLISSISSGIIGILLSLDGIVYDLIRYIYKVFIFLATLNLFGEDDYSAIVRRIYLVLGVVMLFVLAYSLLQAIINPDAFSKNEMSFPKLIMNVVVSLVIIALLPTIFNVAFNVQSAILNNDVIPKLILNPDTSVSVTDVQENGGATMAYYTFQAFFAPDLDYCRSLPDVPLETDPNFMNACMDAIVGKSGFLWDSKEDTLSETNYKVLGLDQEGKANGSSFASYNIFNDEVDSGQIKYTFLISTITGLVICFVLLIYCIDLGLRVVKLVFLQMVAPIPIICRILPNQKKIFDSWLKQTVSTFLEALLRVAIMFVGVYMIALVVQKMPSWVPGNTNLDFMQFLMVRVFLILGIILFIKQAPQMLKDIFGVELSSGGFMGKLAALAGLGATIGGGLASGARNFSKSIRSDRGLIRSMASFGAGAVSGAARTGKNVWGAKNISEVREGVSKGIGAATDARERRSNRTQRYRANGQNFFTGRISDVRDNFDDWITGGYDQYANQKRVIKAVKEKSDSIDSQADIIYNKNQQNNSLQTRLFDNMAKDAQNRFSEQNKNGYVAGVQYKDAYGNKVMVNANNFRDYMQNLAVQTRSLRALNPENIRSKNQMENMIKRLQEQGYKAGDYEDMFGVKHNIQTSDQYDHYVALLNKQMSDIDRGSKKILKVESGKADSHIMEEAALDASEASRTAWIQMKQDLESGKQIVKENQGVATGILGKQATVNSYSDFSDINDAFGERAVEINAEEERLARLRDARGRDNNTKK